ncbi:MAG: hypothetical protein NTV51_03760 [Verrucomicrobia bacterium]|nr:hypothetical protein [Verrucomicrobiota bacterium]
MHGERMEEDAVAGFEVPAQQPVLSRRDLGVDVRHFLEAPAGLELRSGLVEIARREPAAPAVRPRQVFDAGVAPDRIERQPDRAHHLAIHRVVGLVVVPGRALARVRFLHQQVVVVVGDGIRAQHAGRHACRGALVHEAPAAFEPGPELEIDEKLARIAGRRVAPDHRPGIALGPLHIPGDQRQPVGIEDAAQADGAVAAIGLHLGIGGRLQRFAVQHVVVPCTGQS